MQLIVTKSIDKTAIARYLSNFASCYPKDIIALDTPESILVRSNDSF